ncbi:hypothetical protein D3C85_1397470 [compost metagenome]
MKPSRLLFGSAFTCARISTATPWAATDVTGALNCASSAAMPLPRLAKAPSIWRAIRLKTLSANSWVWMTLWASFQVGFVFACSRAVWTCPIPI